jgi:hypothetical protein
MNTDEVIVMSHHAQPHSNVVAGFWEKIPPAHIADWETV